MFRLLQSGCHGKYSSMLHLCLGLERVLQLRMREVRNRFDQLNHVCLPTPSTVLLDCE